MNMIVRCMKKTILFKLTSQTNVPVVVVLVEETPLDGVVVNTADSDLHIPLKGNLCYMLYYLL